MPIQNATQTSRFPLKELFPQRGTLHFLIAHQKTDQISTRIQKLQQKSPHRLAFPYGPFGITPLGVAAMAGDLKTAKQLIGAGCSVDVQDVRLCTPLHYAAMNQDEEMEKLLLEADKVQNCSASVLQNQWGGTYQDTKNWITPHFPFAEDPVFLYQENNGNLVLGTAEQFEKITDAKYLNQTFMTPEFLMEEWCNPSPPDDEYTALGTFFKNKYKEYLENPPRLYLVENNEIRGYDVHVDQDLLPNQIVVTYAGILGNEKFPDDQYLLEKTDARMMRNLGSMINDGLPNCAVVRIRDVEGLPELHVIIALKEIPRGTRLLYNYNGLHSTKLEQHLELNGKEMEDLFVNHSLIEMWETFQQREIRSIEDALEWEAKIAPLRYLANTPSAFIALIMKGVINGKELSALLRDPEFVLALEVPESALGTIKLALVYTLAYLKFQQQHPEMSGDLADFIDELLSETTVLTTIDAMQWVVKKKPSSTTWGTAKTSLLQKEKNSMKIIRLLEWMHCYGNEDQKFKEIEKCIAEIPDPHRKNFISDLKETCKIHFPNQVQFLGAVLR